MTKGERTGRQVLAIKNVRQEDGYIMLVVILTLLSKKMAKNTLTLGDDH